MATLRLENGRSSLKYSNSLSAASKTHAFDIARQQRAWNYGSDASSAIERAKISGADKPLGQYGWAGYANTEFRVIPDAGVSMVFMRQTIPTTHQMSQKLFGILRRGMKIN